MTEVLRISPLDHSTLLQHVPDRPVDQLVYSKQTPNIPFYVIFYFGLYHNFRVAGKYIMTALSGNKRNYGRWRDPFCVDSIYRAWKSFSS